MSGTAIVTDSSACLPARLIERYGILVVPLGLLFDGDFCRDGSLTQEEFFRRLAQSKRAPTTSSPAPADFIEAFRQARNASASGVLCLTLSSAYSGTYSSALKAAEMAERDLPGLPIRVVDTHALAMSHGFATLAAARAVDAGASLDVAAEVASAVGREARLVGTVDTTRYLAKSGRLPWVAHWAAGLLHIKPVLAAEADRASGVGRVRTWSKAYQSMLEYVERGVKPGQPLHVAVMHAGASERASELENILRDRLSPVELLVTELTSVMAVHTGPGFAGVAFYPGTPAEAPAPAESTLEADVDALEASLGALPTPQRASALVVLSGLPGTGKSHLARKLCERYPMARLESDALRKILFQRPTHDKVESRRLFVVAHALLGRLLARNISAVLDATNLIEAERRPLYAIAERHHAKLTLIEVRAAPEVVRQRLEARARSDNAGDRSDAGLDVYELMSAIAEPFGRPHLVIDTSGDIDEAVEKIVRELQTAHV